MDQATRQNLYDLDFIVIAEEGNTMEWRVPANWINQLREELKERSVYRSLSSTLKRTLSYILLITAGKTSEALAPAEEGWSYDFASIQLFLLYLALEMAGIRW